MAKQIQLRRDTAANWTLYNPILAEGEMALETDTKKYKIGDGTTAYASLDYSSLPDDVYTKSETDSLVDILEAADATIIADEKAVAPQIAFNKRIIADGGTVRSKAFMQRVFEANKDLLADTELLFVPEAGMKVTDGKIEKLYNLVGTNDAVQATAGNRPYAGGVIAPNEKANVKAIEGELRLLEFTSSIPFITTDEWSFILRINSKKETFNCQLGVGTYIQGDSSHIRLVDTTLTKTLWEINRAIDLNTNITIVSCYKNGVSYVYYDGILYPTVSELGNANFVLLPFSTVESTGFEGEVSYLHILSRNLTAYESQNIHTFLSSEFPSIETIAVGSQQVATSNLEATVFGGTAIPEVTDNLAWAALSTPAWAHYANDVANGAIYGKLYNGFAVPVINTYAPKDFHIPSALEWTMLSDYLGGDTVSGGKMKAKYGGFDNAFSTNASGISLLANGFRGASGVSAGIGVNGQLWDSSGQEGVYLLNSDSALGMNSGLLASYGFGVRLFSNTPHLEKLTYDSGWFATDIASSPKSIRIPFGCKVTNIKCITTTSVTAIEAKLFNYAGTELETLITGKACNATTKSFSVTADQSVSYTDNYVRVTAAGNSGTGMIIYVTIEAV